MAYEHMDQFTMPKDLYKRLESRVVADLGYESLEALYESDNGDDLELDERMNAIVVSGIEQQLESKS